MNIFNYKNDEIELTEIGEFLRVITNYIIHVEWYLLFDKITGAYKGYSQHIVQPSEYYMKHPDIMLINKKTKKLCSIIEIDGSIHDFKISTTNERNEYYKNANVKCIVINKSEIKTSIFDYLEKVFA